MGREHSASEADGPGGGAAFRGRPDQGDIASLSEASPIEGDSATVNRQRVVDEVLAAVELVLVADGAAFWREEPDH
jgi:hypothetical protein